jgi:Fic family protein
MTMRRPSEHLPADFKEKIAEIDNTAFRYRMQRHSRLAIEAVMKMTSWTEAVYSARVDNTGGDFKSLFIEPPELAPGQTPSAEHVAARAAANCLDAQIRLDPRANPSRRHDRPTIDQISGAHRDIMRGILPNHELGIWRKKEAMIREGDKIIDVCPPPYIIPEMMQNLETYLKGAREHPAVAAAYAHAWFEMIHPFEIGNGRVGRVVANAAAAAGDLPIFPISKIIAEDRDSYYSSLLAATSSDNPDPYIAFHVDATLDAGVHALSLAEGIENHLDQLRPAVTADAPDKGRLYSYFATHPVIDIGRAHDQANVAPRIMASTMNEMSKRSLVVDEPGVDGYLRQPGYMSILETPYRDQRSQNLELHSTAQR